MNRRAFVFGTAATAAAGGILAIEGCRGGSFTPDDPLNPAQTLNVQYATTTLSGYRLRTRTYNGSTLGPVLTARPGKNLKIRVVNSLPANPPAKVPSDRVRIPAPETMMDAMKRKPSATKLSTSIDPMNNPHDFNTTNLHVHGVQTTPHLFDPIGTSDPQAMMLAIEPGSSFTYDFPIPADHPSGLFWFHPHHHGSTDVQVSGGMAGLIAVRGPVDDVPEIKAAREIFAVVQTLNVNPSSNDPTLYELEPVAYQPPANGGYNLGTDFTMVTVNGQGVAWIDNNNAPQNPTALAMPQIQMRPGEVVRLRILNGTNFMFLPLVFPGLEVYLIGFDGINLLEPVQVPLDYAGTVSAAGMFSVNAFMTSPGNRLELLVRAPATPGTYTMSALATSDVAFMPFPQLNLMQFTVAGTPVTMNVPAALPKPEREYPLIADSEIAARRTITYTEGPDTTLLTGFGFYIDGEKYDEMAVPVMPKAGTAEEWTIVNKTTESHPFHIHVNSFQLFAINGVPKSAPDIWDTFIVPPMSGSTPGSITIRIRFKEFTGKSVHHCHVLPHEDTGMMQNILIG